MRLEELVTTTVLEVRGLNKSFGGVRAISDLSFTRLMCSLVYTRQHQATLN